MLPIRNAQTGDICKSQSYNGFDNQKTGPLSCENSRPASSTSAKYNSQFNDLNNNPIKENDNRLNSDLDNHSLNNRLNDQFKMSNSKDNRNDKEISNQLNDDNQQKSNQQTNQLSNQNLEMSDLSNQTRTSNEDLSNDDNLNSNQNESSNEDDSEAKANLNVPNYLLLADDQNKAHNTTLYFSPPHGLQHTALGVRIPKIINTFNDENLEFAYQLYSMRQRHQPLMIINFINFLLTIAFIFLPIILIYKERKDLLNENLFTIELLKLIFVGISLNLHLLLPSLVLLFITLFWTHCANHRLHYIGFITLSITVFLTQLIEKGKKLN